MSKQNSVATQKPQADQADADWRAEAEHRYAERVAGGWIDDAHGAGTPARAHETRALEDWQQAYALGKAAPRGAKAQAERRRQAARAEIAKIPWQPKQKRGATKKIQDTQQVLVAPPNEEGPIIVATQNEEAKTASVAPRKRGRPLIGAAPLTVAERSRRRRERERTDVSEAVALLLRIAQYAPAADAALMLAPYEARLPAIRRAIAAQGTGHSAADDFESLEKKCSSLMSEARQRASSARADQHQTA